jgi:lysophospholipase L1-like esterase
MSETPGSNEPRRIHLFLAGDSTVADYPPDKAPMAGWGQMLPFYLTDDVVVENHAANGRSSKSFVQEGRLERIREQIQEGDYLFVQFAHNDEKPHGTGPFTTFQEYLKQYIDGARHRGATPVLVTPVHRRLFEDGKLKMSHGEYPAAIVQLAEREEVPLIDLMARTQSLYESLGEEGSKRLFVWLRPGEHPNYPEGVQDNTHFHECGAKEVARLVVEEMLRIGLPLAEYVRFPL